MNFIKKINRGLMMLMIISLISSSCVHQLPGVVKAPSNFTYTPNTTTVNVGTAGKSVAPKISNGGGTIIYSITSSSTSITIDSVKGIISWSNAVSAGSYIITVTAANSVGIITTTYTLIVSLPVTQPSNFSYTPSVDTASLGIAGSSVVPTLNNGNASSINFSITNPPVGITIDAATGIISWTVSVAVGTYNLSVVAANSIGNTSTNFTLVVTHDLFVPAKPESKQPKNSSIIINQHL